MKKLTTKDVTPGVKSAVNAYLMARVYAETMREEVDKIERAVLKECPLSNGREQKRGMPAKEITDPKYTYHCTNEDELQDYYEECDKRERKASLKPDSMPFDHCPALVAENIQNKTQWLICDVAAEMLKMDFDGKELNHRLLCMGLDKYNQFIDLVVGLVVNLPGFKNPLNA